MQLVVFALLGCCAIVRSASISDSLNVLPIENEETSSASLESLKKLNPQPSASFEDVKRAKRSGGGSGGFLAGIGSAILGKVAEASSGISSSSSSSSAGKSGHQYESVEYGPPVHGYDDKNFDIWSFKKAILNTLFQALKAIGGGVIALKGKLIKGGGIVISTKGSIISAKGEAISTLGRHIAASAVLTPPKQSHDYLYQAPVVHVPSGHDSYGGPPPSPYSSHGGYTASASSDAYGHTAYASPSDDADHPGLLIVKPLKSLENHQPSYQSIGDDFSASNNHHAIIPRHPTFRALAESFGGSQKDSVVFSYAYYPTLRSDGSVKYQAMNAVYPNYH